MSNHLLRVSEVCRVTEAIVHIRRRMQEQLVRDRVLVCMRARPPH